MVDFHDLLDKVYLTRIRVQVVLRIPVIHIVPTNNSFTLQKYK